MKILLIQLPIPQHNFGKRTGNIPLAAACLKMAVEQATGHLVEIVSEQLATYLGDAALLEHVVRSGADVLGFTVYNWNIERSLYFCKELKRLLGVKTIFGGPEVTPDNSLIDPSLVDMRVYGDGEAALIHLVKTFGNWEGNTIEIDSSSIFEMASSPYLHGLLEPWIEDMVLVETQRGCPYRCGFCHYNKARKRLSVVSDDPVIRTVQWAIDHGIEEVFLLDPSLNTRPGLGKLLDRIRRVNPGGKIHLSSEIRAEAVDPSLAAALGKAGFKDLEIGLQSTNRAALRLMKRPTDLNRFSRGVALLKAEGIRPIIDLIIGLPGDHLDGFKQSVDFVSRHDLADDVQVFFLSVLPGTDFRKHALELGLQYEPRPPYTIWETQGFNRKEMLEAFYYAEETFETALEPMPDLDLSYRLAFRCEGPMDRMPASYLGLDTGYPLISKVIFHHPMDPGELRGIAGRLTHPYQVIFWANSLDEGEIVEALSLFTVQNPLTPLEIVWIEPNSMPNPDRIEAALGLQRPQYLDLDLPAYANRAVIMTWVSTDPVRRFGGALRRQVFHWKKERLPEIAELEALLCLDGVLLDNVLPIEVWDLWQKSMRDVEHQIPRLTFADGELQRRWLMLTQPQEYAFLLKER
jgi:hypothetical protein